MGAVPWAERAQSEGRSARQVRCAGMRAHRADRLDTESRRKHPVGGFGRWIRSPQRPCPPTGRAHAVRKNCAMLQVCLNGVRAKQAHPSVPHTADELAEAAHGAVAAGAEEIHLHPKDPGGRDTLDAEAVSAALLVAAAKAMRL